MSEFHSLTGSLPFVPDDLTIPQFFLDSSHPTRPIRPDNIPWIIDDTSGRKIYYEELRTRTFGLANAFRSKYNIQENDVILLFSPNHVDYPIAIWATHRIGAIISSANPSYTTEELVYQASTVNARLLLTTIAALPTALAAARQIGLSEDRIILFDTASHPEYISIDKLVVEGLAHKPAFVERRLAPGEAKTKIAFLSFSSGTTGKPKAVAIQHFAPIVNVVQMAVHNRLDDEDIPWEERRFRPGDVAIAVLPFFHIYGLLMNMHFIFYTGLSIVVVPKFNFVSMLNSIVSFRITHLLLVPPHIVLLCKHPAVKEYDLSHVRFVLSGAASLSTELTAQLLELFPRATIGQGYGMTETSTTVTWIPLHLKRGVPGSAGWLLPGISARVVKPAPDGEYIDAQGNLKAALAGPGETGELWVRGPSNALGYANNAQATKETWVDGWLRTGDEVTINEAGDLFVVDRLKEIIKVRGFQVAPAELEGCLLGHPDVSDVCVVGIPDTYSGELPLAFVVLKPEAVERMQRGEDRVQVMKEAICSYIAERKTAYKQLAGGVEFVDSIPKNPSGKLLRRVLREQAKTLRAASNREGKARAKL